MYRSSVSSIAFYICRLDHADKLHKIPPVPSSSFLQLVMLELHLVFYLSVLDVVLESHVLQTNAAAKL